MKNVCLLAFVNFVFLQVSFSQEYVPFDMENAKWVMLQVYPDLGSHESYRHWEIYTTHDTIVQSKVYKILELRNLCESSPDLDGNIHVSIADENEVHRIGGLREEDERVYFYRFDDQASFLLYDGGLRLPEYGKEYLLYDFTSNVGDTIHHGLLQWTEILNGDTIYHNKPVYSVVKDIKYPDGVKTYLNHNSTSYVSAELQEIKEGMGSDYGLLAPFYGFLTRLKCYFPDDDISNYCPVCGLTAVNDPAENTKIKIFPVPSDGRVTVESEYLIDAIDILDNSGIVIKSYRDLNRKYINLNPEVPPGNYYLRIHSDQKIMVEKFIIHKR